MSLSRLLLMLALAPLAGCGGAEPCTYTPIHGACTFITATGGEDAIFEFLSDDGTVSDTSSLTFGGSGSPPSQDCLDSLGLQAGDRVGCTLREITNGTCSPVVFEFDDFGTSECE